MPLRAQRKLSAVLYHGEEGAQRPGGDSDHIIDVDGITVGPVPLDRYGRIDRTEGLLDAKAPGDHTGLTGPQLGGGNHRRVQ